MNTAKVTKVSDTGKTYKDFKKVYVELDNGQSGTVNAKSFPPPYGVGDTVEIKATWDDGNLKSIAKVSEDFQSGHTGHSGGTTGHSSDKPAYDPVPGFCCANLAEARRLARDQQGTDIINTSHVADAMFDLIQQHEDVVKIIHAKLAENV